ncbi:receptor-like protein Cf-9 [Nicotiana sylvestris]|uniref:Receptor-like protein 12 n=1 Tax=Nicotiana sylvestris TaxID=4096 RepID=A0A1U7XGK0_NICSY|nr:PREDICTED: receptor-like protein 12 [Nicotiana sylvestris]
MGYEKLALFLLCALLSRLAFSSSSTYLCPKDQALALLQFKQMFTINPDASRCFNSYPTTLSWNRSRDCCSWEGVNCDETTGQVIELNLRCSQLQGKFHSNSSLFKLSSLNKLNLSFNNFSGSHISPKFGEFSSLTHLDLSSSRFSGQIPAEISHLSKLYVLRIPRDYPNELTLGSHNFELLVKNLTQLRVLELNSVNISSTIPLNFSSYLTTLLLPYTQLYGTLPERVFHLPNLKSLDLSYNTQLTVGFPMTKWNSSTSLTDLYLNSVNCTGNIPESFSYLTSLYELDMSSCNLSGPILKPLWNLTRIEFLILEDNQLEGPISQLFRLGNLKRLSLRNNSFDGRLECLNGTQLRHLYISSNFLTGPIPSNVSGLQNLNKLSLSFNYFNGTIPSWIYSLSSLYHLELSNNHFSGKIEEFKSKILKCVILKKNKLQGPIPKSLLNQQNLKFLRLSQNNLSGQIASTICNLKTVQLLDLGSNNLQGTIPECLGEMDRTYVLDLSNNNLSGTIQANFSTGNNLRVIKLHGNKLEGKVSGSLINCNYLELLDLGSNELNDTFPKWLGVLPNLKILNLRSNKLHGSIRASRNRHLFAQLQIMDLSSNAFSGNLPANLFENFQSMKLIDENRSTPRYVGNKYYSVTVTTKGLDHVFVKVLTTNIVIDLSKNGFKGQIPSTIGDLIGLRTLNLSHNGLEGLIPASLQHLYVLESLDLSFNKIGGGIPQQLASLTSLAVLNLSHNHLVGCIPKGNQFDTFGNSSYQENVGLRGFPLSRGCGDDGVTEATTPVVLDQGEEEDSSMINWQAVLMGYGCGLVIGLLMIYIMLSTQNPLWFSRIVVELEQRIVTRMKNHKKRH